MCEQALIYTVQATRGKDLRQIPPPVYIIVVETVGVADSAGNKPPTLADGVGATSVAGSTQRPSSSTFDVVDPVAAAIEQRSSAPASIKLETFAPSVGPPQRPVPLSAGLAPAAGPVSSPLALPPVVISILESVGVTDSPLALPPMVISILESVGVTDSPLALPPVTIIVVESIRVTDLSNINGPTGADVSGDGVVDRDDLRLVGAALGTSESGVDVNGDGFVDLLDLVFIALRFGTVVV